MTLELRAGLARQVICNRNRMARDASAGFAGEHRQDDTGREAYDVPPFAATISDLRESNEASTAEPAHARA